jgi:hypothetical protein
MQCEQAKINVSATAGRLLLVKINSDAIEGAENK